MIIHRWSSLSVRSIGDYIEIAQGLDFSTMGARLDVTNYDKLSPEMAQVSEDYRAIEKLGVPSSSNGHRERFGAGTSIVN